MKIGKNIIRKVNNKFIESYPWGDVLASPYDIAERLVLNNETYLANEKGFEEVRFVLNLYFGYNFKEII